MWFLINTELKTICQYSLNHYLFIVIVGKDTNYFLYLQIMAGRINTCLHFFVGVALLNDYITIYFIMSSSFLECAYKKLIIVKCLEVKNSNIIRGLLDKIIFFSVKMKKMCNYCLFFGKKK